MFYGIEEHTRVDVLHRVQLVLERSDDAEVAAATAQCPEQIFVLLVARDEELPIGRHDVHRDDVVNRQPEPAAEMAAAAAEC